MAFNPQSLTPSTLKSLVDNLSSHIKAHPLSTAPKRSQIQEAVAASLGWPNWHAAITVAKSHEPTKTTSPLPPWCLPTAAFQHKDPLINAGIRLGNSVPPLSDKIWRVDSKDMLRHAMLWGNEGARRDLIEHVAHLNPSRPMVVIHGPASLPLRRWEGLLVDAIPLAKAFSTAPATDIVEVLVSGMMSSPGDAQMWSGRAVSLLSAVVSALVWMRDNEGLLLDQQVIQEYLILENTISLTHRRDLPSVMAQSINAYLHSLPGYKKGAIKQSEVVLEQHGYLQMQFISHSNVGSAHILMGLNLLPSSARALVTLSSGAETGQQERRITDALEQWVINHPGGLLVFDGLLIESTMWESLAQRLPHWKDAGVGVWVGALVSADMPRGALRERIIARVGGELQLS